MKNIIKHKKGENSFITYIKKRIKNNLNFVCLFQGSSGIGKTWSAISMAHQIDNTFDAEKQVTFDFKETMNLINNDWFKKKDWKIIVFDEPQISISNRSWQSLTNKLMNYLLSTFRHQNVIFIMCSPYKDFLDSQSMKMLHCVFECQGVNEKKALSRVKPLLQQYNPSLKKTYQHALYVINEGKVMPMREWLIRKPPMDLIDIYERRKTEFTSRLNKDIEQELNKLSQDIDTEDTKNDTKDKRKPLTAIQLQVMQLLANNSAQEVAKILKKSVDNIYFHKRYSEKKGYRVEEYKDIS